MSSRFDLARAVAEAEPGSEGFAHALNLLVLAIRRTHPGAGPLLDEFSATQADYHDRLRALPPGSAEHARVLADFRAAVQQIHRRLRELQSRSAAPSQACGPQPTPRLH